MLPPALHPGDTLALVAPSGPVDRGRLERAIGEWDSRGFRIKTYGNLYRSRGYLAGDDDQRATELNAALADPEATAVIPARGGYGVTRILDRLDFRPLLRYPKLITGFSDITALHLGVDRTAGLPTFHSPNPQDGLGAPDGLSDLSARTFWQAVLAEAHDDNATTFTVPLTDDELGATKPLTPGVARGPIIGGNLAVLCGTLGSPYEIDTEGRILLIEDVGEPPYRVDRFLSQLRLAGKLQAAVGVIVGQFTDCAPTDDRPSLSVDEVLAEYLAPLGTPVLGNYPVGHARDNATLPLGVEAEVDASSGRIVMTRLPVRLR